MSQVSTAAAECQVHTKAFSLSKVSIVIRGSERVRSLLMATQPLSRDLVFKLESRPHFHKMTYSIKEAFQSRVSDGLW